jgi:hypothetical protein
MDLGLLQQAVRNRHVLLGPHALNAAGADQLTVQEVWDGVLGPSAEVIEDYPTDPRGPSCLIYCLVNGIAEHVVVAYPCAPTAAAMGMPAIAFMITCYRPGGPKYAHKWSADFNHRLP